MHLIVDAHQDLAYNALNFGRDYTLSALETRRRETESGSTAPALNGHATLGLPEYVAGRVAVIFGTLFVAPARHASPASERSSYADPQQAHDLYARQLDYYRQLTDEHETFRLVGTVADLESVLETWAAPDAPGTDVTFGARDERDAREAREARAAQVAADLRDNRDVDNTLPPTTRRIGLVPLMEGADAIREPQEAEWWQERGVRLVGLAWAGTRYAGGTGEPGPLTPEGRRLVDVLGDLGLMLDLAHASDESYLQALDRFQGVVVCSHANPRALMKGFSRPERLLSDEMIERLAEAGGVIGVVPYNRFLKADWQPSDPKSSVTIDHLAAMIDHICQVTGSAAHVGIGSDFDGGFGVERVPAEFDTIADLQKLDAALTLRGYSQQDVAAILGQNWLGVLRRGLPA